LRGDARLRTLAALGGCVVPSLFLLEAICGGLCPERPEGSLLREGRAMLAALAADLVADGAVVVRSTWDRRLGAAPALPVEWTLVDGPDGALRELERQSPRVDRVLAIAPETGGLLESLAVRVIRAGGVWAGCRPEAIALCADKLRLAEHLAQAGVPTLPTLPVESFRGPGAGGWPDGWGETLVVKPRDGAGSQGIAVVRGRDEWLAWKPGATGNEIVQPFVEGASLSLAVLVAPSGSGGEPGRIEPLGLATQRLSRDGRLSYEGGELPCREWPLEPAVAVVRSALATVSGLAGYVGCDLIWPRGAAAPLVCEINPRLTTSYVGYRVLYGPALGRSVVWPEVFAGAAPNAVRVVFGAEGRVTLQGNALAAVHQSVERLRTTDP
jgi:tyramine---L-glutamate ligase